MRYLTRTVSEADLPSDVGRYCRRILHLTKREISAAKYQPDGILVNNRRVRVTEQLRAGDTLSVSLCGRDLSSKQMAAKEQPVSTSAYSSLDILYEDEDLLIVNKRAGMCTHPGRGHYRDTLADLVTAYMPGCPARAVGRLDKDTSGIVIFAKHAPAAARLKAQSRQNHYKVYFFQAHGCDWPDEDVHIYLPLRSEDGQLNRMAFSPQGMQAYTIVRLLQHMPENDTFLAAAIPVTGRTHQIRAHMASLGHPLYGDPIYHTDTVGQNAVCCLPEAAPVPEASLHLHCAYAHLISPFSGKSLCLHAPDPDWMVQIQKRH